MDHRVNKLVRCATCGRRAVDLTRLQGFADTALSQAIKGVASVSVRITEGACAGCPPRAPRLWAAAAARSCAMLSMLISPAAAFGHTTNASTFFPACHHPLAPTHRPVVDAPTLSPRRKWRR